MGAPPQDPGFCATATAGLGETAMSEPGPQLGRLAAIEPGRPIGRYMTLYRLGAGAMGVVFAAYDPQLDRKVAIKLLATQTGKVVDDRLQREAQALAKLDHRNVVTVHDVGVHEGRLFVAMEFVAGRTLGEWMTEQGAPRPWPEVLAVFLDAGRGLVAAHEVGLIHRDFKPDNVMIADDGRVRVMDFGLARSNADRHEPVDALDATLEVNRLTKTGAIVGTPAYMPLEQFRGGEADARSDQFSFCVALYEAIHGRRPFVGATLGELIGALDADAIREPPDTSVPTWLQRAINKGLAKDRAQRWPTMVALLDALADDPAPRRRRWAAAGLIAALIGGSTWVMAASLRADAQTCRGAEQKLAGVWDDEQRAAVEQAMLATKLSYAPDTWARVEGHLDAYADAWLAARIEACEATRQGEQSSELLDLRMACLDRRREHLAATVDELAQADAQIVERAVPLVLALPTLDPCSDLSALRAATPPPEDPAIAEQVAALDERLLLAQAKHDAGKYDDALRLVDAVVVEAKPIQYEPLLARAWLRQGVLRSKTAGDAEQAVVALRQALDAAVAQRMLDVAAQASSELALVVATKQDRYEVGREWAAHADSFSRAVGTTESRATYFGHLGLVAKAQGKFAEARGYAERALAIHEQALGPDHILVAASLENLGSVAYEEGKYAEARGHVERALAITEAMLGPEHPDVATSLNTLAIVAWSLGDFAEARSTNERALKIRERALGPDHVLVSASLSNLGNMAASAGQHAQARGYFERALAIREKVLDPEHRLVASAHISLGNLDFEQLEFAEARQHFERAAEIIGMAQGPEHPDNALAQANLGNVAKAQARHVDALVHYERARAVWAASLGLEHPRVIEVTTDLCDSMIALGKSAEALVELERALANLEGREGEPLVLASVRFVLARALWETPAEQGRDRVRARELAELARRGIAESGQLANRLAEIDAWLAEHHE
jgi:tetratricopeptide (TPR) repeat protein/predicted Ser/Thr protein kinase